MKTRRSAYLIIVILGAFALIGLFMTWDLIRSKVSPEGIALIAGMTGTALGSITGLLAKTEADHPKESSVAIS